MSVENTVYLNSTRSFPPSRLSLQWQSCLSWLTKCAPSGKYPTFTGVFQSHTLPNSHSKTNIYTYGTSTHTHKRVPFLA